MPWPSDGCLPATRSYGALVAPRKLIREDGRPGLQSREFDAGVIETLGPHASPRGSERVSAIRQAAGQHAVLGFHAAVRVQSDANPVADILRKVRPRPLMAFPLPRPDHVQTPLISERRRSPRYQADPPRLARIHVVVRMSISPRSDGHLARLRSCEMDACVDVFLRRRAGHRRGQSDQQQRTHEEPTPSQREGRLQGITQCSESTRPSGYRSMRTR